MQEKLKSLQNIMSQRGYNKSASTARENTDLKSNLKSLQDILVKRGYLSLIHISEPTRP